MAAIFTRHIATIIAGIGLASALLSTLAESAKADAATPLALASSSLITIPDPHEASLLQLHGYSGVGTAQIRIDGQCSSMPVRFVAGDFGGQSITIDRGGPIRLRITDAEMIRALHEGQDLVSEGFAVVGGEAAGIFIESGLPAGTGFVINPGGNILADVFGARPSPVPCSHTELAALGSKCSESEDR